MSEVVSIQLVKVLVSENKTLLEIGRQTFYDAFGPPANTEKNINKYLNKKFTLDQITKEFNNKNSFFYFAKYKNSIVGYLKLNILDAQTEDVEGNTLEIERIYVLKEFQGKKIGHQLIQETIKIAKNKNVDFIWLGVWQKNPKAIQFYQKNGFTPFDKHQFKLGTDIQTDILMKRKLTEK